MPIRNQDPSAVCRYYKHTFFNISHTFDNFSLYWYWSKSYPLKSFCRPLTSLKSLSISELTSPGILLYSS